MYFLNVVVTMQESHTHMCITINFFSKIKNDSTKKLKQRWWPSLKRQKKKRITFLVVRPLQQIDMLLHMNTISPNFTAYEYNITKFHSIWIQYHQISQSMELRNTPNIVRSFSIVLAAQSQYRTSGPVIKETIFFLSF